MRFLPVVLTSLVTVQAALAWSWPRNHCLRADTAHGVAANFEHLFKNYTKEFAESALSKDYSDQTDSVAWLINNGTECPHKVLSNPKQVFESQS